jgi:hypothetical protein
MRTGIVYAWSSNVGAAKEPRELIVHAHNIDSSLIMNRRVA